MTFPVGPINGQQSTQNGVVYTYNSTLTAWTVTTNFVGNITVDQIQANAVTASGNISGTYVLGNVAFATGIPTGYANSNVATFMAAYGANTISTTGNITSGNITVSTSMAVGATTPSGTAGEIRATNAITAFYSDRRLKTEIGRIENALDKIDQLTGVLYTQNKLAEQFGYTNYETQVGLYAQAVQQVQPEAVKPAPFDIDASGESKSGDKYLTVQYEKLVPLLVEGIKELRIEIKKLKIKHNANNS
jgi:trimeric autotransporter adhesin